MDVLPGLLGASQNNGVFLKPGDFKWWLWLETTVAELRTGSWYPQYTEIYQKWFGNHPPPQKFYLSQVTADPACTSPGGCRAPRHSTGPDLPGTRSSRPLPASRV